MVAATESAASNLRVAPNLIPEEPEYRPVERYLPGDFYGLVHPGRVDQRVITSYLTPVQIAEYEQYIPCLLCKRTCAGTCAQRRAKHRAPASGALAAPGVKPAPITDATLRLPIPTTPPQHIPVSVVAPSPDGVGVAHSSLPTEREQTPSASIGGPADVRSSAAGEADASAIDGAEPNTIEETPLPVVAGGVPTVDQVVAGDAAVYSDGAIPAKGAADADFGAESLASIVRRVGTNTASLLDALRDVLVIWPDHPERGQMHLRAGTLLLQRGRDVEAAEAFREAFQCGVCDELAGSSTSSVRQAAGALRHVLAHGSSAWRRDPVLLGACTQLTADNPDVTLLLLAAEAHAANDDEENTIAFIRRAIPDVVREPLPRTARRAQAQIHLSPERAASLLTDLHAALAAWGIDLRRAVAELALTWDPLNATYLKALFECDLEQENGRASEERMDAVHMALEAVDLPADGRDRRRTVSELGEALRFGAEILLEYPPAGVDTDTLAEHVALSLTACLASGNVADSLALLRLAREGATSGRWTPANLVEMADAVYADVPSVSDAVRAELAATYGLAAHRAISLLPRGDRQLLEVVVGALRGIDASSADEAEKALQERLSLLREPAPATGRRLDGLRLAIAGADRGARQRAAEALTRYGVSKVVHIPPAYEEVLSQRDVMARVEAVDLVVNVWKRTKHQTSDLVDAALRQLDHVKQIFARGGGWSSIVREVLASASPNRI